MSTSPNPQPQGHSLLFSAASWITLPALTQAGLFYLSLTGLLILTSWLFWSWPVGILLSYLLTGLLAALWAGGYRSRRQAVERGILIGLIAGAGGAVLAIFMDLLLFIWSIQRQAIGSPFTIQSLLPLFPWGIAFLLVNLFGVVLATLGGLLGGFVRSLKERSISTSLEPQPRVRSLLLSAILWIILSLLIQIELIRYAFTSASGWPWLAGTTLCYLLVGLLAAFRAGGYRSRGQAVKRGAFIGFIVGAGSVVLVALAELLLSIWAIHDTQTHSQHGLPSGLGLAFFFVWEGVCLLVNLLCIAPAALGGLLGGSLRFMKGKINVNHPGATSPGA